MNFNIIDIPELESTNTHALNGFSSKEFRDGDVIVTGNQTSGRGQADNVWESEEGKNLTFSIVLEPNFIDASQQFVITQVVSLALVRVLDGVIGRGSLTIKWPNDIYFNDSKIAGILIQNIISGNRIVCSIVGIGLNVNQVEFFSDAPNPVSIKNIIEHDIDSGLILESLLNSFRGIYGSISSDVRNVKDEYLSRLYVYKSEHGFRDKNGKFIGRIIDVDEFGRLIIAGPEGLVRTYLFKEVEFLMSE